MEREFNGYVVSSEGKVFSHKRQGLKKELIQEYMKTNNGIYKRVTLRIDGKSIRYTIHRLVAICFIENKENKPDVNHIDNNPSNNNVENLEWCTNSENMIHAYKQGRLDDSIRKSVESNKDRSMKNVETYCEANNIGFIKLEANGKRQHLTFITSCRHEIKRSRFDSLKERSISMLCEKCSEVISLEKYILTYSQKIIKLKEEILCLQKI